MGCKNTKIPDSVTQIGEQAFAGCSDLSDITIPNGVTNIAAWAFWDCSKLKRITIPPNVTNIGSWAVGWGTSEGNGNGSGVAYSDFIPASNEPSSRARADIWRMPRGSNTPPLGAERTS